MSAADKLRELELATIRNIRKSCYGPDNEK
jgi:hypothetical protein